MKGVGTMNSVNDMEYALKKIFKEKAYTISKEFYSKNHIKLLSDSEKKMISAHIYQHRKIKTEPFLLTNIGDAFVYSKKDHSVFLYYSRLNEMDFVLKFENEDFEFDWFINVFLKDMGVLYDVFNMELTTVNLKKSEILYCSPFLNDEKTNYLPMEINLAFHFFNEHY